MSTVTFEDLRSWPNLDAVRTSEVEGIFWDRWRPALEAHNLTRESFIMLVFPAVQVGNMEYVDVAVGDRVTGDPTDMSTRVYADLHEDFQYCGTEPWMSCSHIFPADVDM